jgi:hypothetical protein
MTRQNARQAHEPALGCSTEATGPECARRHYARATAALRRSRLSGVWQCTAAGRAAMTALADLPPLCDRIDRLNHSCRRHQDLEAAARATLAAHADGEADPLYYLRDELEAEGQSPVVGTQRW